MRDRNGSVVLGLESAGVEDIETLLLSHWRRILRHRLLEQSIQFTRADRSRGGFLHLLDHMEEALHMLALQGGCGDEWRVVEEEEFASDVFRELFETLLTTAFRVVKIVFVSEDNAGFAFIEDDSSNAAILGGDASGPIDNQRTNVSAANAPLGAHHAEDFDRVVDLRATADARRVDQIKVLAPEFVGDVDGITGRARDVAYDRALLT